MRWSYRLPWLLCRLVFRVWFRWRVFHADRVPANGPVILAGNHASFLDPPLVGAAVLRPLNYLARDTLFPLPVLGALLRLWEVVPVDREGGGAAGLKGILDRLLSGGAILLFPEGTRTRDGRLQPARPGLGLIVAKSTAPVVPVRLFGTFAAFGRGKRFPRPRQVIVKFGPPLRFEQLRAEVHACSKARSKEIYQQITDEVMRAIAALEPGEDVGRGE
jgi:1-acyl-sn-glycerol-3-phosphate acyltransferase